MKIPAPVLTLALAVLSLTGCQNSTADEAEAQRLTEALERPPGVMRVTSEYVEARVGYSSEITLAVEMPAERMGQSIPGVLDAWSAASPSWNANLLIMAADGRCRLSVDANGTSSGDERTSLFLESLCAAFPKSDVGIVLDQAPEGAPELMLDVSDDGIAHADEALAARIRALPGADAPITHWFVTGSGDDGRYTDLAIPR